LHLAIGWIFFILLCVLFKRLSKDGFTAFLLVYLPFVMYSFSLTVHLSSKVNRYLKTMDYVKWREIQNKRRKVMGIIIEWLIISNLLKIAKDDPNLKRLVLNYNSSLISYIAAFFSGAFLFLFMNI